ncbi:MAG: metallophosphoesterase [bacterium]|nr:metallophosphoesterase [bacterium]
MDAADTGQLLLLGDVHSRFPVIAAQIEHACVDLGQHVSRVVVAGDLGLFAPELKRHFRSQGSRFSTPVSFIEGNHEDFRAFDSLVDSYADVLTYLPRSTVQAIDGRRVLCLGGARYMDSWSTPRGCEITDHDIDACLALEPGAVDFVVSHDCPCGIGVPGAVGFEHLGRRACPASSALLPASGRRCGSSAHHHRWHEMEKRGTR